MNNHEPQTTKTNQDSPSKNVGLFATNRRMKIETKEYKKENHIELVQDFNEFSFSVGYSYTKSEKWSHLIHISIMFWYIDFAWCWHRWEEKNIVHYSEDGKTSEVMPHTGMKCKHCLKFKF